MIPVSEPLIGDSELAYVREAMESGWVSSAGHYLDRFEEEFAEYCGRRHGVTTTSGTTALQLAVACLDSEPGDEIIIPSFTIISCVLAALYEGFKPVLVDVDPDTWCMDVAQVAAKIGPRTRAIMPVHMYGHPVDMTAVQALAKEHDLAVIEDAAQAHGAEFNGVKCGGFGDMSCFSFYANKNITTGEGGMVLCDDANLAEALRKKRNLCFGGPRRFVHDDLGFNFRMTNLQAAMGVGQLERIEQTVARKREVAQAYSKGLGGLPIQLPVERAGAKNVYWMYGLVLHDSVDFDAQRFAELLRERGVDTRPFFVGMHQQPALLERGFFAAERYPETERLSSRGLYLPSGQTLTDDEVETVIAAVRDVFAS